MWRRRLARLAVSLARQGQSKALPNVIRILVDRDFASSFLAGHIGQFLLRNPGVSVEVVAERNGRMRLEEDFNFRIFYGHFGATPCPGLREKILCRWYDLVVCTPDYAAEHVNKDGVLVDAQLLIDGNYNVWDSWFAQTGLRHPGPARDVTNFNETSLCLSTALTGWRHHHRCVRSWPFLPSARAGLHCPFVMGWKANSATRSSTVPTGGIPQRKHPSLDGCPKLSGIIKLKLTRFF